MFESELEITFFVPCYNEESNVLGAIEKLVKVARELDMSYEILVYDDASQDGTVEVVERFQKEHSELPVFLYRNPVNQGVARNFVAAAFAGHGEYFRLICGDDVEPLETHRAMLEQRGRADIIIPYFTHIEGRKWYRHVISRLFTTLANLASGYRLRYYNGCPLYRRFDVIRWHIETTGFGYQAEFLTRLFGEGKSYLEVPMTSCDREGSASLTLRNFLSVSHSLIQMALRRLTVTLFR